MWEEEATWEKWKKWNQDLINFRLKCIPNKMEMAVRKSRIDKSPPLKHIDMPIIMVDSAKDSEID